MASDETYTFTQCHSNGCGFSSAHHVGKDLSRDRRFAIYKCAKGHETKVPVKWLPKSYPRSYK